MRFSPMTIFDTIYRAQLHWFFSLVDADTASRVSFVVSNNSRNWDVIVKNVKKTVAQKNEEKNETTNTTNNAQITIIYLK